MGLVEGWVAMDMSWKTGIQIQFKEESIYYEGS